MFWLLKIVTSMGHQEALLSENFCTSIYVWCPDMILFSPFVVLEHVLDPPIGKMMLSNIRHTL